MCIKNNNSKALLFDEITEGRRLAQERLSAGTVERDYNLSEDQAYALRGVRIVSCKGGTRAVAEPSRPGDEKKKRGTKNWFSL